MAHRKFTEEKLVIASHNEGKVREIKELIGDTIEVVSGSSFNLPEPEETGDTFIANAEIKSRYFAEATGLPSLSDDSGLVVPALGGSPGVYSARWAGPEKDFELAMTKVEQALIEATEAADGHHAHFTCALSLCWPDGHIENFEGRVEGRLTFPSRGDKGFGYDPIFIPRGYSVTFGEMTPEEKHGISHRAAAFNQLMRVCFTPEGESVRA